MAKKETVQEQIERLDRALANSILSFGNYDSNAWTQDKSLDKGIAHALTTDFLTNEHNNEAIPLALMKYQRENFTPVKLPLLKSGIYSTSAGESIYYEYDSSTFLVPSTKQLKESHSQSDLSERVDNTHFNVSLFSSKNKKTNNDTLHLVFRGTEQGLDSVLKKYSVDAYTDLDKYYRQMQIYEKALFKYIDENPNVKEIEITGHSLGGAVAQYFHERNQKFFEEKGITLKSTTFGSPGADARGWFVSLKEHWRNMRESVSDFTKGISSNSDKKYLYEMHALDDAKNNFEKSTTLISKVTSGFKLALRSVSASAQVVSSSIINKIHDFTSYKRVQDSEYFVNKDTEEQKSSYDQHHYRQRIDPIPIVGAIAYDKNGDTFTIKNHLKKQKLSNFLSIMGAHTSDGYTHNIINQIQKTINDPANAELKEKIAEIAPNFTVYASGYKHLLEQKEILKNEITEDVIDTMVKNQFSAAKTFKKEGKTHTDIKPKEKYNPLTVTISSPYFLTNTHPNLDISLKVFNTQKSNEFFVPTYSIVDTSQINTHGNFGMYSSSDLAALNASASCSVSLNYSLSKSDINNENGSKINAVFGFNTSEPHNLGEKLKHHATKGNLEEILLESCTHPSHKHNAGDAIKNLHNYNDQVLTTLNVKNKDKGFFKRVGDVLNYFGVYNNIAQKNEEELSKKKTLYFAEHGTDQSTMRERLKAITALLEKPPIIDPVKVMERVEASAQIKYIDSFKQNNIQRFS